MILNELDLKLIALGIEEDLGKNFVDVTSDLMFADRTLNSEKAIIISKHATDVVVSGLFCVEPILRAIVGASSQKYSSGAVIPRAVSDPGSSAYNINFDLKDGDIVKPRRRLLELSGDPALLLKAERLILNFLRHLSAVATMTSLFVKAVEGTQAKILDTRKTTPGFRHLEKLAVHHGGGVNHRMGLYDAIMVKDTHVDLVGGMSATLKKLPLLKNSALPAIVEVRSLEELNIVLKEGREKVSRVLLDNIRGPALKECVRAARGIFETEASGNMTLANVRETAESGVDFISVGMITHSAGQVDLSMKSLRHD